MTDFMRIPGDGASRPNDSWAGYHCVRAACTRLLARVSVGEDEEPTLAVRNRNNIIGCVRNGRPTMTRERQTKREDRNMPLMTKLKEIMPWKRKPVETHEVMSL